MSLTVQAVNVALAVLALWLLKKVTEKKPIGRKIPGPKGWPIIGNLLDVPNEVEYQVFSRWRQKYGDLIQMTVLGQPIIIINSPKLATDILSKKSAIYSSRPHLTMACDLVGWKDVLVLLKYTDKFKSCRRMFQSVIGTRASVDKFRDTLEQESSEMVRRVLDEPDNFVGPVRKAVGVTILRITHGYKPKSENDELVRIADEATDQLNILLSPGLFAVDTLPILRYIPEWFPGGGFHKIAREWRHTLFDLTDKSYEFVLEQMAKGTAVPNFVTNLLEGRKVTPAEEDEIKWAASSLYSGGADTPVSAMSSFLLAMTMYPEVQKKIQAELDSVVGYDRLPTFNDRDSLPYLATALKEVIRWGPTTPLGAPHCVEQDDVHDGFFIPKGSIIMANIWHFMHDPEVYKDPTTFNPDRLIAQPGKAAEPDPFDFAFGYGRRACPGNQLAQSIMFIFAATTLSVFDINKVVINGVVQEPKNEFTSGVLVRPKPFKSILKPRSAKAEALIRSLELSD
ncbi:cytochrome P450 [Gloeopeniophorella convolvens]|nr:cytochrome P450 [Gloeopeniophorella convolvens]